MQQKRVSATIHVTTVVDGTSTHLQRRYRSTNSATYTGTIPTTEDSPSGWGAVNTPTQVTTTNRYRWMIERYSNDGGTTWSYWSPPVIDYYFAADGTSISIKGEAVKVIPWNQHSEGYPESPKAGDVVLLNNDSSDDLEIRESGSWEGYNVSMGDGYLIDGHLWMKVADTATSTKPRWKDVGDIKGPKGDDGEVWTLNPDYSVINFTRNALGEYIAPTSYIIKCGYIRTQGDDTETVDWGSANNSAPYVYRRFMQSSGTTTSWSKAATATVQTTDTYRFVEFCLSNAPSFTSVDSYPKLATVGIPILRDGAIGVQGATGRLAYPAGEWSSNNIYTRTATSTPVVHYTDSNGTDGGYWYLDADNATGSDEPNASSNKWKPADKFGMVITEMLFTMFAKLGGFVVAGDFFISQYGTLVPSSGSEIAVGMNNAATLYPESTSATDRRVPYAWFDGSDPMATGARPASGKYKFRPMKVVNAVTGEEWMAEGKVHVDSGGNVTMNNVTVNDATIKGSLMFHNVVIESSSNGLGIANQTDSIHPSLKGDIFVVSRNYSTFNISFPPAYLFPGAQVKIVIDRSNDITYQLAVTRLSAEQSEYTDNWGEVYNGFVNILSSNYGVSLLNFSSKSTRSGYITASVLELVSVENPIHRGYYVWMLVDAR